MICPECSSDKIMKFGFRLTRRGRIQRYQCQVCARVFSEAEEDKQKEVD
jgi:transposase-like protein